MIESLKKKLSLSCFFFQVPTQVLRLGNVVLTGTQFFLET